jgi:molecular chaperone GrpE
MVRRNGKPEVEEADLDAGHELIPSEVEPAGVETIDASGDRGSVPSPRNELQKLAAERDMLLDRLARAQAEFDNARKRAAKEQQDYRDYAQADAIKALLPILDSFERALATNPAGHESLSNVEFRNGVDLIYKQLQDALQRLGMQPIAAAGQPFDPHLHEAIEMVDTDEAEDQTVIGELQRGYKLKDRLLRPAMVKVARNNRQ